MAPTPWGKHGASILCQDFSYEIVSDDKETEDRMRHVSTGCLLDMMPAALPAVIIDP